MPGAPNVTVTIKVANLEQFEAAMKIARGEVDAHVDPHHQGLIIEATKLADAARVVIASAEGSTGGIRQRDLDKLGDAVAALDAELYG